MNEIGAILQSAQHLLPPNAQAELVAQLGNAETLEAAPIGAILMGMYILTFVGFPAYVDEQLGEEHTSIEQLKHHYQNKAPSEKPMIPSTGIILSLMVADMIACPRHMTRTYEFERMAEQWRTGPLLGIEPCLLNDDRIGRAMSHIGGVPRTMQEVLFQMVINAGKKAGIPLNKFILDTTLLQLSGTFKNAPKVVPGRGMDSFSQLIVSLVIASGSRLPVGFAVLAGNTSDSTTLPGIYNAVHRLADEGDIEFLMDRIYPTPSNILFLKAHEDERKVHWVSPLKMGLSEKRVRELIDAACRDQTWKVISYRSTKEIQAKIEAPLTAFEATWTLKEEIKPELAPGQKRRPHGSIQIVEIEVRCIFYRHQRNAEKEMERRNIQKEQMEQALQDFNTKLNKRKYRELEYSEQKLAALLKTSSVKKFVKIDLNQTEDGVIHFSWVWNEQAMKAEEKYDGIFALLTNYAKEQVNPNQLVQKYRGRDEIEVDFKEMKGILDLEKILYQIPERIETYLFLKVMAFFVLAFLRSYAEKEGVKTTERKIQEGMGDLLLVENQILPLGMKSYGLARDTALNQRFRQLLSLPNPLDLIRRLSEEEIAQVDAYVLQWYEARKPCT